MLILKYWNRALISLSLRLCLKENAPNIIETQSILTFDKKLVLISLNLILFTIAFSQSVCVCVCLCII